MGATQAATLRGNFPGFSQLAGRSMKFES